ncbi:hypothetical protein PWT90_10029 [Aphanocladium album]|nr:hypothetical protein PWT90_10029 [Aphanocladium album]
MSRNIWFDDNWRIVAKIATLLADCSKFILCTTGGSPGYYEKRRVLKGQIQRVGKLAAKLRDIKVKELCDHDPAANIYTAYTKLSQAKEAKEGRVSGWEIHFLGPCVEAMIVCFILPTALGGSDALVHIENVGRLTEWLDLYEKRLPSIFFRFKGLIADLLKATLMTIDEWREFAAETEASAKQGKILVVGPNLFRRWLTLIGIKPRANQ